MLIITSSIGAVSHYYSVEKRLSIVEQDILHLEQDMIQQDKQLDRVEDKVDKIYTILAGKSDPKRTVYKKTAQVAFLLKEGAL